MNTEDQDCGQHADAADLELSAADQWIRARLAATIVATRAALDGYRFDLAAQAIHEFAWGELCDWYLELSKPVLTDPNAAPAAQRGTRWTLVQTLETLLRLLHPFMPFITEEIWQKIKPLAGVDGATIMLAPYPVATESAAPAAVAEIEWARQFILGVRRIRGEMNIPPSKPLPVLIANASARERAWTASTRPYLDFLARTASITFLDDDAAAPEAAIALVGTMKILIPLSGAIDKAAELARLDKDIARLEAEIERSAAKLANPNFADKAPAEVVHKERARLDERRAALAELTAQRERIAALGAAA